MTHLDVLQIPCTFPTSTLLFSLIIPVDFDVNPVEQVSCATWCVPWLSLPFQATWEEVSAAWRSGTHPSLLALEKLGKTGARGEGSISVAFPCRKGDFLRSLDYLSWWESEQPHLLFLPHFYFRLRQEFFWSQSLCVCAVFKFQLDSVTVCVLVYALPKNSRVALCLLICYVSQTGSVQQKQNLSHRCEPHT